MSALQLDVNRRWVVSSYESQPPSILTQKRDFVSKINHDIRQFKSGVRFDKCYTCGCRSPETVRMRIVFNGIFPLALHPYREGPSSKCLILSNIESHHLEGMALLKKVVECIVQKNVYPLPYTFPLKSSSTASHAVDVSYFALKLRFDLIGSPPSFSKIIPHKIPYAVSALRYSPTTILFPKPESINVLKNGIGKLSIFLTFPELQKALQTGPLYVNGVRDPSALFDKELQIKEHRIENLTLCPWELNDDILDYPAPCTQLLLLGMRKIKEVELVYFTGARHEATSPTSNISTFTSSGYLSKIYFTTLRAFDDYHLGLYPSREQRTVVTHEAVEILPQIEEEKKKNPS